MRKFALSKRLEIAGSHQLVLSYPSPCCKLHGHNFIVTINVEGDVLDPNGMLIDFRHIKDAVHKPLDHAHLNDVLIDNPTAENVAKWCSDQVQASIDKDWREWARPWDNLTGAAVQFEDRPVVSLVTCAETEGNVASFRR